MRPSFIKPDTQSIIDAMQMPPLPIEALGRQVQGSLSPLPPAPMAIPADFQMQPELPPVAEPVFYPRPIAQVTKEAVGASPAIQPSNILDALQARLKPTTEDVVRSIESRMTGKYVSPEDIVGQRIEQLKVISGLTAGSNEPSNVREYQYFSQLSPEEQQRYLNVKRSQQWLNLGGEYRNPASGEGLTKSVPPEQMPTFKGEQKAAEEKAKYEQEKVTLKPRAISSYQMANNKINNTLTVIDDIEKQINWSTTGTAGELQAIVPGSPAYDLRANIDTLLADAGFRELQDMRDSSPTGGALGQVTERELELLQSRITAIKASQSEPQLRRNLQRFKEQLKKSLAAAKDAYYQTYGEYPSPIKTENEQENPDPLGLR